MSWVWSAQVGHKVSQVRSRRHSSKPFGRGRLLIDHHATEGECLLFPFAFVSISMSDVAKIVSQHSRKGVRLKTRMNNSVIIICLLRRSADLHAYVHLRLLVHTFRHSAAPGAVSGRGVCKWKQSQVKEISPPVESFSQSAHLPVKGALRISTHRRHLGLSSSLFVAVLVPCGVSSGPTRGVRCIRNSPPPRHAPSCSL